MEQNYTLYLLSLEIAQRSLRPSDPFNYCYKATGARYLLSSLSLLVSFLCDIPVCFFQKISEWNANSDTIGVGFYSIKEVEVLVMKTPVIRVDSNSQM